jgi:hypothetical protein
MKCLRRIVIGVLWAGLCTGVCAGQAETPPGAGTATTPNETKDTVQGKVVAGFAVSPGTVLDVVVGAKGGLRPVRAW